MELKGPNVARKWSEIFLFSLSVSVCVVMVSSFVSSVGQILAVCVIHSGSIGTC